MFYLYQTVTATEGGSQQYGGPEGHRFLQQKHFSKNVQSMTFEEKHNTSVNTMTFHKREQHLKKKITKHFRDDSQKNISISQNKTFNKTAAF